MTDKHTPEQRRYNMSRVRGRDTKPEILVRSILHRNGYRFRLHVRSLPGNSDIVMKKHQKIVFVNGCFWHVHEGCSRAKKPASNVEFWGKKLSANVERDKANQKLLRKLGWQLLIEPLAKVGKNVIFFIQIEINV